MPRATKLPRALAPLLVVLAAPAGVRAQGAPSLPTARVLSACYVPKSGTVYLIREPGLDQSCTKSSHVPFSWTDGAPALREPVTVEGPLVVAPAHTNTESIALCPTGTRLLSGGYVFPVFSDRGMPVLFKSGPVVLPDGKAGWHVAIHNSAGDAIEVKFRAIALCAR